MRRPQNCKKQWIREYYQEEKEEDERACPKWMTHYCSDHQIRLVGDGDFSFSLSLAKAFGSSANMVASSLDTYGFHGKEDNFKMIKMHMDLVFGFFKNASHMLRQNGEVHVNHKTTHPFNTWNIERLAEQSFLMMIECVDFKQKDYLGYNNKRGHRSRCDDPFPLGKCSTFKFIYNPRSVNDHLRRNYMEVSRQMTNLSLQESQNTDRFPAPVDLNLHPRTRLPFEVIQNMERIPTPVAQRPSLWSGLEGMLRKGFGIEIYVMQ